MRSIADAHVLLIGTGNHDTPPGGDRLVDVPSVATTLADLRAAFAERCALPADRVRVLPDPADPVEFGDAVPTLADRSDGIAVLYFIGHGLVSPPGALHPATRRTSGKSETVPSGGLEPDPRKPLVNGSMDGSLFAKTGSWIFGANIPGKTRTVMFYFGGLKQYREILDRTAADGYDSLVFGQAGSPVMARPR